MSLAPIILFTFNRLEHTKRTIESLKGNKLSIKSELFIFSDGSRNLEEEKQVQEVRNYLKTIDGFKNITIISAKRNKGLARSVIDGVTEIINRYEKVIVLEDDLITSPYFLDYMNDSLDIYKNRGDIWSISGYCPNIKIPNEYNDEVFLIRRGSSWGWATWKDRWQMNDWDIKDYNDFKKDRKRKSDFNIAGNDMSHMLNDQMEGRINSWAIRWGYNQYNRNMWTVYPVKSFVNNIGNDLSGTHSSINDKFNVDIYDNIIKINYDVMINEQVCYEFKKFYNLNFIGYIGIMIKKIGLYKLGRKIRNYILIKLN